MDMRIQRFENFLKNKGFHVVQAAYSNYSYTLFSMASMLNMDYLHGFNKDSMDMGYGYNLALKTISSNYLCRYLKQQGYAINNLSIFDLPGVPTNYYNSFVPLGANIITNKTLYNRLLKTLSVAMANNHNLRWMQDWAHGKIFKNNSAAMEESLKIAVQEKKQPVFTYVHLMMPHVPLAFDSAGNRMFVKYNADNYPVAGYENAYLQYLVYTNKKMQQYITTLQQATRGNAVILLMGDHGYRGLNCSYEKKMQFSTLNAVYLPGKNYNDWYNTMSNVNQLRVLLNTVFGEKIGMVKDGVVF
ncbi:MAG: LTA synthase family protein [Bacteroidia bacterium]|nr:LTA synthase family protein [Bacteroidia bacterium]